MGAEGPSLTLYMRKAIRCGACLELSAHTACVGSGVLVSCISFGLIIEGSFDSELATIHLYYIKIVHFTSCVEMSAVESAVHVQHAAYEVPHL